MELSGAASWVLVIGYLILAIGSVAAFAGIALGLSKLNAQLEHLTEKVDPALQKVDHLLELADEKVTHIGDRAEEILTQGAETAESVHLKVDQTTHAVQRTVHAPIINLNSLVAGVTRGVETFGQLQRQGSRMESLTALHSEDVVPAENHFASSITGNTNSSGRSADTEPFEPVGIAAELPVVQLNSIKE